MAQVFNININNHEIKVENGQTLFETAAQAGIYIPGLCSYPNLTPLPGIEPDMACKLCLVELEGRLVLSCDIKVQPGMEVKTDTLRVKEARYRNLLDILSRHPGSCRPYWESKKQQAFDEYLQKLSIEERCELCPANDRCELQKAAEYMAIQKAPSSIPKQLEIREDSPFFVRDNNLCILCERCVRVCDEIRGAKAIEFAYPCHKACPAGIDIPRYVRAIAHGRPDTALAVIREKVPFPGVLGRVCIHPCEQACQREKIEECSLQIRLLKRFAADQGDESWKKLAWHRQPSGRNVAVIGAGPAGLTTAYYLAKLGHEVTVFEAAPQPGGMMLLGIPEYRLPRKTLFDEIQYISDEGVKIKTNSRISSVKSLLEQGYDAICIAIGAHQGMKLGIEGEDSPGIMEAVEFLRCGNLGEKISVGSQVGIVGGGNVAIDTARMALRFGAKIVKIFYRRTRAEMPAATEEIDAAMAEGVEIQYLTAPTRVEKVDNIIRLNCVRMKLGEPDQSGRPRPEPISGSNFSSDLDTLFLAIGQRPGIPDDFGVETGRGNVIKVNVNMMTSYPGVFSAGDCVSGPASVIEAIAEGRKAAEAIDRYLGGEGDIEELLVGPEESLAFPEEPPVTEKVGRVSHLSPHESINSFDEVEQPWDQETAMAEAQRCLRCYVIAPAHEKTLKEADCQFCGACVDACPTGALLERNAFYSGKSDRTVTTTCPYCGVGCQLNVHVKDEKITIVTPSLTGPANKGQACVKGKFGLDFVHSAERLTVPLIKRNGRFEEASWDEALELIARKFTIYKPHELAVIASAKCTNEENYLIQKFTRAILGTNNIDHCARLCHAPSVAGLVSSFGSGAMTNSIADIAEANCILAIGTNTTAAHPVIALEIAKAVKRGARLIVANPRKIELCNFADSWLNLRPGSDVALLMGMMKVIVDEKLYDKEFIEKRCENFDSFKDSLQKFDLPYVESLTGLSGKQIQEAARMFTTQKPATTLYAMGVTQHSHGTDNVIATANLVMLTGNIGKPGSGLNPLRGQNNVQGACDMGCLPNVYTGYQAVSDEKIKAKFEEAWGCKLSPQPGMTLTEIMHAAHDKRIKSIFLLIGENPLLSEPTMKDISESLSSLDFLVVQDIFLSETAQFANIVLPAASFAEKDGTFTNTERRIQRIRKIIEPIGQSKPDWESICLIARKLGRKGFSYQSPSEIMDEIARLTPSYGGISYERLEKQSLQWPCPTAEHPGTPILHTKTFSRGKGRFIPLDYKPPAELPDDHYPLILTTERSLYHYHTGTMSRKVAGLNMLKEQEEVEINPVDASNLGIMDGERVKVASRRGEVEAKAKVTEASPVGVVSMSFHFAESPTNAITSTYIDPVAKIPELKVCAVKIIKKLA